MVDYSLSLPRSSYSPWMVCVFPSHTVPHTLLRGHICFAPSLLDFSMGPSDAVFI